MKTVTSNDGTRIAYDQVGEGAPVILVDGALCSRAFGPMPHLTPLLAKHFTVFMFDRRGRNESGDTLPYAVEREIEDIGTLIREAGGSAFVYGTSSGAVLALRAAASGLNIRKLALFEPPFSMGEAALQVAADYTTQLTGVLAAGNRGGAIEAFMTRVGTPPEAVAGMRQSPMWGALEAVAPTLGYDNAVMGDSAVPSRLANTINVPTLVMDGGASPAFMRAAAKALADAIPNAKYRTLEGQTHDAAADAVAPALIEFFGTA